MNNFRDRNKFTDKRGASRGGSRNRDGDRPMMHNVVCDECGKNCKVPFKPSGDKPVYCNECFGKRNSGGKNQSRGRQNFSRRDYRDDRARKPNVSFKQNDENILRLEKTLKSLGTKLDTIISLLSVKKEEQVEPAKKKKVTKASAKKVKVVKVKAKAKAKKTVSKD